MTLIKYSFIFSFMLLFSACDIENQEAGQASTIEETPMTLTPLSPYKYEFMGQNGKSRIDYFFSEKNIWRNPILRENLQKMVDNIRPEDLSEYSLYSVYVYLETDQLNENFTGDSSSLRGTYDTKLICYIRWNKEKNDIFYFIESGKVVFDFLKNEEISEPWEFD